MSLKFSNDYLVLVRSISKNTVPLWYFASESFLKLTAKVLKGDI